MNEKFKYKTENKELNFNSYLEKFGGKIAKGSTRKYGASDEPTIKNSIVF